MRRSKNRIRVGAARTLVLVVLLLVVGALAGVAGPASANATVRVTVAAMDTVLLDPNGAVLISGIRVETPNGIDCGLGHTVCTTLHESGTELQFKITLDGPITADISQYISIYGDKVCYNIHKVNDYYICSRAISDPSSFRVVVNNQYAAERTVTTSVVGPGTVTGSSAFAGTVGGDSFSCGDGGVDCSVTYRGTTTVLLTATPLEGAEFAGWSGASCTGSFDAQPAEICAVSTEASKSVTATFVRTPKGLKEASVGTLQALLPTGDDKLDKTIEHAIKHLERSLTAEWWLDDMTLDSKDGKKVFDEEKKAVKELDKADVGAPVVQALLEADEELAQGAIDDAWAAYDAAGCNVTVTRECEKAAKELDKAAEEMAKAQEELDKGHSDHAIGKYKKAWEKAHKALKKLS